MTGGDSPTTLNRTLLELKLAQPALMEAVGIASQSNLIGIETILPALCVIRIPNSQSNLIGIETRTLFEARRMPPRTLNRTLLELKLNLHFHVSLPPALSIEPYWN